MRTAIFVISLLIIGFAGTLPAQEFVYPQTTELVTFVEGAVQLMSTEGLAAFDKFRDNTGEWFKGDDYIFVWEEGGTRIVYPPDAMGEGQDMNGLLDSDGRQIGRLIIETAQNGGGWVHYKWPRPGREVPEWKSTYILPATLGAGTSYIVGSGKYGLPTEPAFVVDAVRRAVELVETVGPAAFPEIGDLVGDFVFLDTYVFIKDMDGNEVLNPLNPDLQGKSLLEMPDANGKLFVKEELDLLAEQDEIWFDYAWPRPSDNQVANKRVFLKKAPFGDIVYVVGAGYYPAE